MFSKESGFRLFVNENDAIATAVPELGGIALSPATFTQPNQAMEALELASNSHLVMNRLVGRTDAPAWLVKGLSDYLALCPADASGRKQLGKLAIKAGRREFELMKLLNREAARLQLSELLHDRIGGPSFDDPKTRRARLQTNDLLFEAASWSLVHFLLHGEVPSGQEFLIDAIRKAQAGQDVAEAVPVLLKSGALEDLQTRWRRYIGKMK